MRSKPLISPWVQSMENPVGVTGMINYRVDIRSERSLTIGSGDPMIVGFVEKP